MTSAEQKYSDDIKLIGEVRWGFKHSGYVSGLERLGDKIDLSSRKRTGIDYSPVYWFCREVAIATRNSNNCQSDPRKDAQDLVDRGLLTKEERDYVYGQFGFNPDSFTPPDWMK